MTFLLDTNVVSEIRKAHKAAPALVSWLQSVSAGQLYLSAITMLELEIGVLSVRRRDAARGELLRRWLDDIVRPGFAGRTIVVDDAIAIRCAPLHVPDRRPLADSLIAATALVHDLIIVTRNVRDFEPMGVRLFNPWEVEPA